MYNVSFSKTDKVFSDDEIVKVLPFLKTEGKIDIDKFNIKRDENGTILRIRV